eukprot:TRINITY_DN12502_c1_g2_i1.p1 TRINITY_DN12502_c1_g2~~TRINITY_DN12502_c1_g2_i1.p1  ORF type:complete len:207 (-),score=-18.04 TRINITY_DN12502_c1_g2_i1:30-650(-)
MQNDNLQQQLKGKINNGEILPFIIIRKINSYSVPSVPKVFVDFFFFTYQNIYTYTYALLLFLSQITNLTVNTKFRFYPNNVIIIINKKKYTLLSEKKITIFQIVHMLKNIFQFKDCIVTQFIIYKHFQKFEVNSNKIFAQNKQNTKYFKKKSQLTLKKRQQFLPPYQFIPTIAYVQYNISLLLLLFNISQQCQQFSQSYQKKLSCQ